MPPVHKEAIDVLKAVRDRLRKENEAWFNKFMSALNELEGDSAKLETALAELFSLALDNEPLLDFLLKDTRFSIELLNGHELVSEESVLDLSRLLEIHDEMTVLCTTDMDANSADRFLQLDADFHVCLGEKRGVQYQREIMHAAQTVLAEYSVPKVYEDMHATLKEHAQIIETIEEKDSKHLEIALKAHIDLSLDRLKNRYKQHSLSGLAKSMEGEMPEQHATGGADFFEIVGATDSFKLPSIGEKQRKAQALFVRDSETVSEECPNFRKWVVYTVNGCEFASVEAAQCHQFVSDNLQADEAVVDYMYPHQEQDSEEL